MMINNQTTQLLSARDVAKILKISVSFAYELMRIGRIKTIRIGRAVRVAPQHLDEYIEAHTFKHGRPCQSPSDVMRIDGMLDEV